MQVCPACGEENPPKFRLCGYCGTPLTPVLPHQEVRKTVTIVFSDLKGSTSLGEALDSESLREVMTRYFDAMSAELERHGGTIEKFIGDAVMAVFGLPKLHEDDALRAVRAAAGMQRALEELNDDLERRYGVRLVNRTGVNTGEVVAGDPTGGQRLVTGDAVNVAARLEQAAGACEVLLGELTHRLVRDFVDAEAVEPLELKGKSQRVAAYRLTAVRADGSGRGRREGALVGRADELEQLTGAYDDVVAERRCKLVTIVGEPGVGKSRLVQELASAVERDALVLRGRCLPYGDGITFWPLLEAVRQAAGIAERDSAEEARTKLAALTRESGEVTDRVAAAIGLSPAPFAVEELFWGVRKLFEELARRRPLVVVFEDLHWAEATFLHLVEHLFDTTEDAPLLLLCLTRHELVERLPDWGTQPGSVRIELEPLSGAGSAELVENLLGDAGLDEQVRAQIVTAADGNPLFVEQLLSMMIDEGYLRREDGRWAPAVEIGRLAVPPTIQALLASRLDHLEPNERAVVEPASVVGYEFQADAVRYLEPEPLRDELPAHLAALTEKQLVRPDLSRPIDEEGYRFRHILIRDTAYERLLKRAHSTKRSWSVARASTRRSSATT
jgi:class 3 adenylate cyclase